MRAPHIGISNAVSYIDRLRDFVDKWLFFIIFMLGAISIVMMKAIGLAQIVVTATPVILMFGYAVYTYLSPGFRLREDRIADNLYYLGFLYTLTSLAYSLYLFSQDQTETTLIISNFGIALVTTIVGLALRVLFSQLREDPVEYEHEARYELSQAVQHLKVELYESVLEFNSFRRSLQQSLQESINEMLISSKQLLDIHSEQYVLTTKNFINEFNQAINGFAQESSRINTYIANTANELSALTMRINAIEVPPDLIISKIEPTLIVITKLVEQVSSHIQNETLYFNRFHSLLEQVGSSHLQLEQTLGKLMDAYCQQSTTLEQHTMRVQSIVESLKQLITDSSLSIMRQTEAQIQQSLQFKHAMSDAVAQHQQALDTGIQNIRELSTKLIHENKDQQELINFKLEQLHKIITVLEQTQIPLEQLNQSIATQIRTLIKISHHSEAHDALDQIQNLKRRIDVIQNNQTNRGWFRWFRRV